MSDAQDPASNQDLTDSTPSLLLTFYLQGYSYNPSPTCEVLPAWKTHLQPTFFSFIFADVPCSCLFLLLSNIRLISSFTLTICLLGAKVASSLREGTLMWLWTDMSRKRRWGWTHKRKTKWALLMTSQTESNCNVYRRLSSHWAPWVKDPSKTFELFFWGETKNPSK